MKMERRSKRKKEKKLCHRGGDLLILNIQFPSKELSWKLAKKKKKDLKTEEEVVGS